VKVFPPSRQEYEERIAPGESCVWHSYVHIQGECIYKTSRAWEVTRTVVAPPVSVVSACERCSFGGLVVRVCAGVGGVFSVGVSCVRVTC